MPFKAVSPAPPKRVNRITTRNCSRSLSLVIRRYDITEQTFYRWKKVYAGMGVPDIRRLKAMAAWNWSFKRAFGLGSIFSSRACAVFAMTVCGVITCLILY